jgi:UDP:flavonoid glycosyltransferase YjiC (YdhE family)
MDRADSLIEATYAGVPQIILPAWFDLYTLAMRTEWLGYGISGNKGSEPELNAEKFADALVRLLRDKPGEEGERIRERAGEIGRMCRKERGDRKAADAILRVARGGKRAD